MAYRNDVGYAANSLASTEAGPGPAPGTLPGLIDRAEHLARRANELREAAMSLELAVVGHRAPQPESPTTAAPKSVPTGFIEKLDETFDALSGWLSNIEDSLRNLHSKA